MPSNQGLRIGGSGYPNVGRKTGEGYLQGDEARIVLATPVRDEHEDFYAWYHDSKGQFSVKSAYKVYVKIRDAGLPQCSNPQLNSWNWKEIWSLPCQPKIQQFVWRLAHNSLPLKLNMKRRGIDCDTMCVCYRRLDEDGAHLFLRCKQVKKVWRSLQLEALRQTFCTYRNATALLDRILRLPEDKKTLVVCLLWKWWGWRNKMNAGIKYIDPRLSHSDPRLKKKTKKYLK